jgi:ABC-2 type transport system ATP-binding protein
VPLAAAANVAAMTPRRLAAVAASALVVGSVAVATPSSASTSTSPVVTDACISSVPEPRSAAPVDICYTLFQPPGATARTPVPLVFHSHGWGGSRITSAGDVASYLDDGYGVLSFDQRGFGESGGRAHSLRPDIEGEDVVALVDLVAGLDWVKKDRGTKDDPVIGAVGGSYGGGYQFLGAFVDQAKRGATRFNALAPEITWNDLKTALAPDEVSRSTWMGLLVGISTMDNDEEAQRGFVYGSATGLWAGPGSLPDTDLDAFFEKNGPKWHVSQGRRLDIPVLIGQGLSDTLFNLNEGVANFDTALTPAARAKSVLVGYNGGHVLPTTLPRGAATSGDPCSARLGGGSFAALAQSFFDQHLKGAKTAVPGTGRYHLATMDASRCVTVDSVAPNTSVGLGEVATTSALGGPLHYELAAGPLTVAGIPRVDATVTSVGVNNKAFFALSVGTSPADAVVVQHNMLPLHEEVPLVGTARSLDLPGVAVDVQPGQKLFLTVSPVSDMSATSGSRVPGAFVLRDTVVQLPVVE